jgi:hypothetical protein
MAVLLLLALALPGAAGAATGTGAAAGATTRGEGVGLRLRHWKNVPIQTNPGGYQIVAYLGLATPTGSPQIGPPRRP